MVPNFVEIGQTIAEICQFIYFSVWQPFAIFDLWGMNLNDSHRVLDGLYCCAKSGSNHFTSFHIWNFYYFSCMKMPIYAPKLGFCGFWPLTKEIKKPLKWFFFLIWKNNCRSIWVQSCLAYSRQLSIRWLPNRDKVSRLVFTQRDAILNICLITDATCSLSTSLHWMAVHFIISCNILLQKCKDLVFDAERKLVI